VKIRAALSLAAAVVTAALAANPIASADPVTNPEMRGQLAAILSFCARIYPPGDQVYRGLGKLVLGFDQPGGGFEASPEYRKAFEATRAALDRIPHEQALQACKAAVKG
jgi:hypothetical protein